MATWGVGHGFCKYWQRKASMAVLVKALVEMGVLTKAARKTLKVVTVAMTVGQRAVGDPSWSYQGSGLREHCRQPGGGGSCRLFKKRQGVG